MAWQAADRTPAPTGWSLHQLVRLLYRDPTPEQVLALWLALARIMALLPFVNPEG